MSDYLKILKARAARAGVQITHHGVLRNIGFDVMAGERSLSNNKRYLSLADCEKILAFVELGIARGKFKLVEKPLTQENILAVRAASVGLNLIKTSQERSRTGLEVISQLFELIDDKNLVVISNASLSVINQFLSQRGA